MEKSLSHSDTQTKHDNAGKINPKSKKIPPSISNNKFLQDQLKKVQPLRNTPNQVGKTTQNPKKRSQTSREKKLTPKDLTQKKAPINSKKPSHEEITAPTAPKKRRQLKQSQPPEKVPEYIYIYDPHKEFMNKHLLVQGEDINSQLDKNQLYIPPFHSCDEDCESTEEIVQRGVEKSKRDLFTEIERRKNLPKLSRNNRKIRREPQSDSGQESDDENETNGSKRTL